MGKKKKKSPGLKNLDAESAPGLLSLGGRGGGKLGELTSEVSLVVRCQAFCKKRIKIQIGNIFNIGELMVNVLRGSFCPLFPFLSRVPDHRSSVCFLPVQCFLPSLSNAVLATGAALTE